MTQMYDRMVVSWIWVARLCWCRYEGDVHLVSKNRPTYLCDHEDHLDPKGSMLCKEAFCPYWQGLKKTRQSTADKVRMLNNE